MEKILALILVTFHVVFGSGRSNQHRTGDPSAYLAINAWAKTSHGVVTQRRLELNWFNIDEKETVRVALYKTDPSILSKTAELKPILIVNNSEISRGYFVTSIQLPHKSQREIGYKSQCMFHYWIRVENSTPPHTAITEARCLKSQPSWMYNNKNILGHVRFGDLFLPGSHDSGAYKKYGGSHDDNWITSTAFTQEESIAQQMQWGTRYVDIRVGYYPLTKEKFWIVHGVIRIRPIQIDLDDVAEYLRNSRDIVVWDLAKFEHSHWGTQTHTEFKHKLWKAFHRWWVRPIYLNVTRDTSAYDITLNKIWSRGPENEGRIILIYQDLAHDDPRLFFPRANRRWGNKNDPKELMEYLEREVQNAFHDPVAYHPWVPNCQMTETFMDIISGRYLGTRDMADRVNRYISNKWATDWNQMTSVWPIQDYILSSDLVHVAIERNKNLANRVMSYSMT